MSTLFFINRFTIVGRGTQVKFYLQIMKLRMNEFSKPRRFFSLGTNFREYERRINQGR